MAPKKVLKYVVIAVVACNMAIIAVVLLGGKSERPEPMPNPNGYHDFVRAGEMLQGRALNFYETNNVQALSDFLSKNKAALQLVHVGLSRECRVPNDYSSNYMSSLLRDGSSIRDLAFALCAEGRIAEIEHRTNDAAINYLDGIRYGVMSSRGGLMTSKLGGIACESVARPCLKTLEPTLDAHVCSDVAQKLEKISADEELPEANIRREEDFAVKSDGLRGRLMLIVDYRELRNFREHFTRVYQTNRLDRIRLMVKFAVRAFELEKGKKPQNVKELVPEYLRSVPIDPITGTNIAHVP